MALILTGSSGSTTLDSSAGLTFSDSSNQQYAASPYVLKNRIINGAMVIDQRYAGTATASTINGYVVDRWVVNQNASTGKLIAQQNQGSVTPPAGFTNYLGVTSQSAYAVGSTDWYSFQYNIEGYNVADLAYGTANAKTCTLSFWVRSSLTGTFAGTFGNSASTRAYPFTYIISTANTWEQKTITVYGDTSGSWNTTNGVGLYLMLSLGMGSTYTTGTANNSWATSTTISIPSGGTSVVGTSGATFYITGVQLEIGSSATPFERRLYNQELFNCQRYYWKFTGPAYAGVCAGYSNSTTGGNFIIKYPVTMRAAPTFSTGGLSINNTAGNYAVTSVASGYAGTDTAFTSITVASGLTAGQGCVMTINSAGTGYLDGTSEL